MQLARRAMRAHQNYVHLGLQGKHELAAKAAQLSKMAMEKAIDLGFRFVAQPQKPVGPLAKPPVQQPPVIVPSDEPLPNPPVEGKTPPRYAGDNKQINVEDK